MAKKLMSFKTKGMNRDLSVSAFNSEFSFENHNLRLSTNEGNTLMSWVNERGTKPLVFVTGDWKETGDNLAQVTEISGIPIGTAIINNQLVLFTHIPNEAPYGETEVVQNPDHIYVIKYSDKEAGEIKGIELFHGDLNFDVEHPLETLVSYESEVIQKVYWVDGKNQPRLINIGSNTSKYYDDYGHPINTVFDFVRELQLNEEVAVTKVFNGSGEFPAGVIQYAFTYFNKYGQESNIFHVTPLYYISDLDRANSPEEKVSCAFNISLRNLDDTFEYVRIYSIIRTSLNSVPICKKIGDYLVEALSSIEQEDSIEKDLNTPITVLDSLDATLSCMSIALDGTTFKRVSEFTPEELGYFDTAGSNLTTLFEAAQGEVSYALWKQDLLRVGQIPFAYALSYSDYPNLRIKANGVSSLDLTWPDDANESTVLYITPVGYRQVIFLGGWTHIIDSDLTPDNIIILCKQRVDASSPWELKPLKQTEYNYANSPIVDTNTIGETIDPTHLLYLGNNKIIAQTLEQKDNTLFLGGISTPISSIDSTIKQKILEENEVTTDNPIIENSKVECVLQERLFASIGKNNLNYINTLSCFESDKYSGASAFKSNEYYRLGVQFQHKSGAWSEPCWIGDKRWELPSSPGPSASYSGLTGILNLPEFEYTISADIQSKLINKGYKKVRAVYVSPTPNDRTILCQGIINPTVYRSVERDDGICYAQSSWLFRAPFVRNTNTGHLDSNYTTGTNVKELCGSVHYMGHPGTIFNTTTFIRHMGNDGGEQEYISINEGVWMGYYRSTEVMGYYDDDEIFKIDNRFGTINSPEVDFDFWGAVDSMDGVSLYKVGETQLQRTYGDIDIQTSTPPIGPNSTGFIHKEMSTFGTSAIISGNFYEDCIVTCDELDDDGIPKAYKPLDSYPVLWPVYMWHRKGSLNNDAERVGRSANLKKKIISNYRFAGNSVYEAASKKNITDVQVFRNTEAAQIIKVSGKIYKGCVDTAIKPSAASDLYFVGMPFEGNDLDKIRDYTGTEYNFSRIKPEFSALPVLKMHQNDMYNPDPDVSVYKANVYNSVDFDYDDEETYRFGSAYNRFWFIPNKSTLTQESGNSGSVYWVPCKEGYSVGGKIAALGYSNEIVPIKYKSSPHIVVALPNASGEIYSWVDCESINDNGKLSIVEIRRDYNKNVIFGGTSENAFQSATWIPCGPSVRLDKNKDTVIEYKWGDTYFQRYECLKTYPYTPEDINQVVEIGSFLLETRVNIDGRYDRNRCQASNLNVSPQNFNLINPVYSQMDNFFSYKILPEDYYKNTEFNNQITWTLTKESGADVDAWTNITLASILELDGTCGQLNKLIKLNDQLLAFQDTGISQILYNENAQITTTEGISVELGNSGKVTGKKYFSNTVGCSNKWSIAKSGTGIYFMDSHEKSIYLFNGQLTNLSDRFGFNAWSKNNIPSAKVKWNPIDFNMFVSYYDRINQEVLFINRDTALAFSEKMGAFTSFYDYQSIPYFCNLEDTGLWVTSSGELWQHQTGEYCRFFDTNYPYYMTLIGNPEPQTDKIFTNLEFRACVEGEGDTVNGKYIPTIPFDYIETWNEYQHGIANLSVKSGIGAGMHHLADKTASLNRKFRMWRCDIPRDNAELDADAALGISRYAKHPLDRMRNPWIYIKLVKNEAAQDYLSDEIGIGGELGLVTASLPKAEIHDLVMTYYN